MSLNCAEESGSGASKRIKSECIESENGPVKKPKLEHQEMSEMSVDFDQQAGPSKMIKSENFESENVPVKKQKLEHEKISETSPDFGEQPGPSQTIKSESIELFESKNGPVNRQKRLNNYDALGVKSTYHGIVYQQKLLTLFLKRGLDKKYSFTLATEMVAAERFDDIVFGYTTEQGDVCRFLQVKHKVNENEKITLSDLLTENEDNNFCLKKYFSSYCKIKRKPEFKGYKWEDFVICTNIDLDDKLKDGFEEITGTDNILHFESCGKKFKRFKINRRSFPEMSTLLSIFKQTSKLYRLANVLASDTYKKNRLELGDDLLIEYHAALGEKVIERVPDNDGVAKFRREFICGQSPELKRFREAFYVEYLKASKQKLDEDKFWENIEKKELSISSTFGEKFNPIKDPTLTNPKSLAEEIAKMINGANEKTVEIVRKKGRNAKLGVVNCNIDKLGGYVFVKKVVVVKKGDENNEAYCFSSEFLDEDKELCANLGVFRDELKKNLDNIEFTEMNEYKFHIPNFKTKTCEERQLYSKDSLPDDSVDEADIDDFLNRFVFSVNQPNEVELGHIIDNEIGEYFRLVDSEMLASKLQKDMLDWIKHKKGTFITNEVGTVLFKEISQNTSKLVLIGPTLLYLAKIDQFQISFRDDLIALQNFLGLKTKQVFNLINFHETIFGSIKVVQTLNNLDKYKRDDSYIFMTLQNVLFIKHRVKEAFTSGTCGLLVIECKPERNMGSPDELYIELATILKDHKNKKVILITLKNDTFAQKFRDNFHQNNCYTEIEDFETNLNDLTEESQENILKEAKVVFQGIEANLGSVLDADSTHILSGDVLSMLINDEEIQIGKSLMDSKYEDVKDYFVDRTFGRCLVIKKAILQENNFLVIEDSQKKDTVELNESSGRDILVISSTCDHFKKLCEKFDTVNIHWLKKKSNQLIWLKSRGNLTQLRKFVDTREQCITKYKPNEISKITDVSDKVFLLAAEAGMGKSVILSHLALKTQFASSSAVWIVRSNLLDYSTLFNERLNNYNEINVLQAMEFLCEIAHFQHFKYSEEDEQSKKMLYRALAEENIEIQNAKNKGLSLLEIKLFLHFFHNGKVLLLFDGFDEISPDYNDLVVKLLKVLKDTKVTKIWLTTRPYNIQSEPEDELSTFSYALMPFVKEEQHDFLMKFWSKNLGLNDLCKSRADIFINELLDRFSVSINDQNRKFLSIPLQLYMIATVFSQEFENFYLSSSGELTAENKYTLDRKLDLVTLYEAFVKTMFDIEQRKDRSAFDLDKDKPSAKRKMEKALEEFKENNKKLAVYSMLKKNQLANILSRKELEEVDDLMSNISDAGEKTGIISKIICNNPREVKGAGDLSGVMSNAGRNTVMITEIVNNKPVFIHRTFAEYFSACYVWEKLQSIQFEKFGKNFIQNIVKEILIKNNFVQISKFLQLIAKNYFSSKICFPDARKKMDMLLVELSKQIKEHGSKTSTSQCTKILLGIIEFFLLEHLEEYDLKIKEIFKFVSNKPLKPLLLKLLLVCAEIGYIGLAKTLKRYLDERCSLEWPRSEKVSYKELLLEYLNNIAWKDSPLWIAFEKGHLNMAQFLVHDLSFNITWNDKDRVDFIQHIISINAFGVLKSCIELDITNDEFFKNLHGVDRKKLLLYEALKENAPLEVIELLIERTDVDLINNFNDCVHNEISVKEHMSLLLLQYDKKITELAIGKGIELSSGVNILLRKFTSESLYNPAYKLIHGHADSSMSFLELKTESSDVFPSIELLLKASARYNDCGDGNDQRTNVQYAERIHHIHQLLNEVHKVYKLKNVNQNDPRNLLIKLIVDIIRRIPGFKGLKIIIKPEHVSISPSCDDEDNNSEIGKLIKNFIEKSPYFKSFDIIHEENEIPISRNRRSEHYSDKTYPTFKRDMTEMFFEYYNRTWPDDLAKSATSKLRSCKVDMQKIFKVFKKHHRRNVIDIFCSDGSSSSTYEKEVKQVENYEEKKRQYESLDDLEKGLLSSVLSLYFQQDYEKIDDAVKEVSDEALEVEKVMRRMLEMKNDSCEYDADKILDVLGLKNVSASEKIQELAFKINDIEGINLLIEVCLLLNDIGQKNLKKTLQSMCRFSDQSTRIFNLFHP